MGKENKGSNTIRRRKNKPTVEEISKAREKCPSAPLVASSLEDEGSYMFNEEVLGPSPMKQIMSSDQQLFLGLFAFRTVNALLVQTYFVPDEFWQSQEVAHKMVFGYGYLTWEWRYGLRGYLYPSMFAIFFKILAVFGLDNRLMLIKMPRIVQGFWAACGDLFLYKLSRRLSDRPTAQWALLCQILSWVTLYMSTRTLSNSLESVLTVMALYYYPWPGKPRLGSWKFLALAALSVLIRPTAAVVWILLCSWHLQQQKQNLLRQLRVYVLVGSVALASSALLDRLCYGHWVNVQYNFMEFNVLSGMGTFYGSHPWHWYLTQGVPILLTTHLLPFTLGVWWARNKVLLWVILWIIFIYSFLGHKEFRFLYSLVPMAMYYCGVYCQSLCTLPRIHRKKLKQQQAKLSSEDQSDSANNKYSDAEDSPPTMPVEAKPLPIELQQQQKHKFSLMKAKLLTIFLAVTNIPIVLYFSLIHQRGTIEVMRYLYQQGEAQDINVMFLMPCHSTPYYSYLHLNQTMRFLTCEPNFGRMENYTDEADIFFTDPEKWLTMEYDMGNSSLPTHFVYFDGLIPDIQGFLSKHKYVTKIKLFHTHLPEGRVGSKVLVSTLNKKLNPKR
ncbi:GPI mannosyltransferase 3-like [Liolophura sinensis]|uniref:GPI mannosyltransferase 3-like n=1 Tax=Liolophura sinensis TaxID=3198878 RepID=UPI003159756A